MNDINKVRVQLDSDDIIDHIDLHANLKPILTTFLDRLEAAEKRTAKLEERCATLTDALRLAVRQNSHDMLMTAEELRSCEAILEETK